MAQIAIPLVIVGALYLMSNDKEGFKSKEGDEVEELEVGKPFTLLQDKTINFRNNKATSKHAMNNEGTYSQFQDKYFLKNSTQKDTTFNNGPESSFTSLNGEKMLNKEISHNNMKVFYGSKSYGNLPDSSYENSHLDQFSGAGSLSIEKKEISSLFKPQSNIHNVFGSQNQSDFLQSRINNSMRNANTTPWEQVRDNKGELGLNWAMADRDKSMPKSVDELRVANNPKSNYLLNYQAPAYDPKANQPMIGKIVKKGPDTYHVNNSMEMMGNPHGRDKARTIPNQMVTTEQRDTTNVEYYGVRGVDDIGYTTTGKEGYVHKQSLQSDTVLNFANSTLKPTDEQNYGKSGHKAYTNNRDSDTDYFGSIQGAFLANVVNPLVRTLKHTKKKDSEVPLSNLKGSAKSIVFNPREHMPVTNREMNTEKIGMNHLSMERQSATGYMVANPHLPDTQRPSTNVESYGTANGIDKQRSYGAEYNQRNIQKPYENRIPNGNDKKYQSESNFKVVNKEQSVQYQNVAMKTGTPQVHMMGQQTKNVNHYENRNESYHNEDLLKAFKSNPYTQPIGSVA
jgi:hypothetical protein